MSTAVESAVVSALSSKDVNTRFGTKKTYSFQADGVWYSCGFTEPKFNKGDVISFEYEEDKYGKQVDPKAVRKSAGAPAAVPAVAAGNSARAGGGGSGGYGSKGVFPIPALDGQRSIIRQNALTNARELYVSQDITSLGLSLQEQAKDIIRVARLFEAYSAGDLDLEEAKAETDAALAKAAGTSA